MKKLQPILFSLLLCLQIITMSSCQSGPGNGGTSSITGKVVETEYNLSGIPVYVYNAVETNVYLIYGDGSVQDDNTKTSYDGTYEFNFLRQGSYKLYVYSDCPACTGFTEAKIIDVEVTKNHQVITAPEIDIEKH